ncbi:DUF3237 domain-containing protein [Paractinoplanes durhamensis]|uniref:UPF0311 protein Adu01nite_38530 n=1 Tax=Paractinoplanes durhamensis TaxID=113563 RepID=A0ABQ3YY49_9ACTN|nr:DUF3237 domain-containing protein [Actinoplanes durhamensis]GIE02503.1 UPF0311 protein [Actinoplanes durhamensis]
MKPELEFLADAEITLGPVQELGETPAGCRRIIPITGGTFDGPELAGEILPGGADWQLIRPDGVAVIDTRYTLATGDGGLIYVSTQGYRHGPPEVIERLTAGETVDPADYYFRLMVRLESPAGRYAYLNRSLILATAVRLPNAVRYGAYLLR